MRSFTKEELDKLKEFEDRFRSAIDSRYVRNIHPNLLASIKTIYDEASGENYNLNAGCSYCVLTFMSKVGVKYFQDLDKYKENAAKLVEALDDVFGEVPDIEPKQKKPAAKTNKPKAKKTNK